MPLAVCPFSLMNVLRQDDTLYLFISFNSQKLRPKEKRRSVLKKNEKRRNQNLKMLCQTLERPKCFAPHERKTRHFHKFELEQKNVSIPSRVRPKWASGNLVSIGSRHLARISKSKCYGYLYFHR